MNWVGLDTRGSIGLVLGAMVGGWMYVWFYRHRIEAAWMVGLVVGVGCALLSRTHSHMRGLVAATCAIWIAATAQAHCVHPSIGAGLVAFHEDLDGRRALAFIACALLAAVIGGRSLHRGAPPRMSGT